MLVPRPNLLRSLLKLNSSHEGLSYNCKCETILMSIIFGQLFLLKEINRKVSINVRET
jgi:hypothetical protein